MNRTSAAILGSILATAGLIGTGEGMARWPLREMPRPRRKHTGGTTGSPWGRLYPAQGKGHGRTGNQLRARRAKRRRRVRSRRTARRGSNR